MTATPSTKTKFFGGIALLAIVFGSIIFFKSTTKSELTDKPLAAAPIKRSETPTSAAPTSANVLHPTTLAEYKRIIDTANKENKLVVTDFFAKWCPPCRMMGPIFERTADKFAGKAVFVKIDIEEGREIAEKYEIKSIPTFLIIRCGEVVATDRGGMVEDLFVNKIEAHIRR